MGFTEPLTALSVAFGIRRRVVPVTANLNHKVNAMRQHSVTAALGLLGALAVVPAYAQTANSGASSTRPNATASTTTTSANAGNTSGWITRPGQNQWLASHLKGLNVYNAQNQKISSIDELIMDQNGNVQAVVLDVGGFLGMGVRRVAVPFHELRFVETPVGQNTANNNANNNNRANTAANTTANTTVGNTAAGNPSANTAANTALGGPTNTGSNVNTTATGGTAASTASSTGTTARGRNDNWPDHALLNMTQDQLKNAPEFKYNS